MKWKAIAYILLVVATGGWLLPFIIAAGVAEHIAREQKQNIAEIDKEVVEEALAYAELTREDREVTVTVEGSVWEMSIDDDGGGASVRLQPENVMECTVCARGWLVLEDGEVARPCMSCGNEHP